MGLGSTLSVAVTVKVTMAPEGPVASACIEGGTVRTGGVVSITVTWNNPVTLFPWESEAEQTTFVVTKTGKVDPEAGRHVTATGPSTRSVAEAEYVTTAPLGPNAEAVISAGSVRTGGVVSLTVMVKEAEPTLPAASVAVHVTVVVPNEKVEPEPGEQIAGSEPLAMSVADAEKVATAPLGPVASFVIEAGTVKTGGVVSRTVTVKVPWIELPEESVAVQDTIVVPRAKVEPDVGEQTTLGDGSTMSTEVTEKVTAAPLGAVASAVMPAGRDRTGGVVSTIVTLKLALALLPEKSVAEHWTVVDPSGYVEPDCDEQTMVGFGSTRSVAVTVKVTMAPEGPVASTIRAAGTVRVGGVVSTTFT